MFTRSCVLSTLVAVACPAFAAEPGPPASQLDRVTVEAPAPALPRVDVRTACPGVDLQLQQTLSSAWGEVRQAGTMQVRFTLEGGRVTVVKASGLSQGYQPYVRRAVRRLACTGAPVQPQEYRFLIVLRDPDEAVTGGGEALALVSQD